MQRKVSWRNWIAGREGRGLPARRVPPRSDHLVIIFKVSVMTACVSVHHMYAWLLQRLEEGIRYLVIRVTDGCELPYRWSGPRSDHLVIIFKVSVIPACVSVHHMYAWLLQRLEECIRYLVIRVTDGCELPYRW